MKSFKQDKLFYSITEVAEMFEVNTPTLRYWESEFDSIRPHRSQKGTRQYRPEDIEAIRRVHYLVKDKGFTLIGAKEKLKGNAVGVATTEEIVHQLKAIRHELSALIDEFDELEKLMPGNKRG
jgi:DNA-binding transcriptional MerR regulator